MINGTGMELLGWWWGIMDDAFQFNIKRAVISLYASADRNMLRVVSDPDRELAFLIVNQSLWSKQLRIHTEHIDAPEDRLHPLLLNHLHRNFVDATAVANKDFKSLADG